MTTIEILLISILAVLVIDLLIRIKTRYEKAKSNKEFIKFMISEFDKSEKHKNGKDL